MSLDMGYYTRSEITEVLFVLLDILFGHATDIAEPFFIFFSLFVLLFELSERVQHHTADQIPKEHLHKHNEHNIKNKSAYYKFIHIISNGSRSVHNQHTI